MIKDKNKKNNFYYSNDSNKNESAFSDVSLILKNRINIVLKSFLIIISIILVRLLYLGFSHTNEINFYNFISEKDYNTRLNIVDRSNLLIATSVDVYDLVLKVDKARNLSELLAKLKKEKEFKNINVEEIKKESLLKKRIVLKKKLDPEEYKKAVLLGEPSLELNKRQVRIYPQRNLFSHVLGQIDDDYKGISGIESYFNSKILNTTDPSSTFQITLDSVIQSQIRQELLEAINTYSSKGAAALLMNVNSGEIISLVSLPDFDPNRRESLNDNKFLNKITLGTYELGSVFKSFVIADALELKLVDENTIFENLQSKTYCGNKVFHEHDKKIKNLTTSEILIKSSNVGAMLIGEKVNKERYKNFLTKIGLFDLPSVEIPEKTKPLNVNWSECTLDTASYGHGISTTPIQLASAYATLVNGGYKIYPTLIKKKNSHKQERIISSDTSSRMIKMLRRVVDKTDPAEGTGRKADISGYSVIGKTGTADKPAKDTKGYTHQYISVFVAIYPEENPENLLLIMIDEPKSSITKGIYRTESAWNAVPVAGSIIKKIGPILAEKNYNIAFNVKQDK